MNTFYTFYAHFIWTELTKSILLRAETCVRVYAPPVMVSVRASIHMERAHKSENI